MQMRKINREKGSPGRTLSHTHISSIVGNSEVVRLRSEVTREIVV